MKCLTIKEPYASLIKNNIKHIETRTWNTSYRGKLYIHAGKSKLAKNLSLDLQKLIKGMDFKYSEIICECELKDVIYMTEEFIQDIKNNHYEEYICGNYQVGNYAWLLTNVKPLNKPLKIKGKLSIWNYYTEDDIIKIMNDIEYGWVNKKGQKYIDNDELFGKNYILQSPQELLKSKLGVCWDQVELERYLFKQSSYEFNTYFIIHYDNTNCSTHTFLVYKKGQKYYWFEHSWVLYKGIREYNSLEELLQDVKDKFVKDMLNNNFKKDNLHLYEYLKPQYNIGADEFIRWAEKGKEVKL